MVAGLSCLDPELRSSAASLATATHGVEQTVRIDRAARELLGSAMTPQQRLTAFG